MRHVLIALCLIALCLIAFSASAVPAQRLVYVPDNVINGGSCNLTPFGNQSEWRYQVLVTRAQLGNLPGRITGAAFAFCLSGVFSASTLEIRIAHSFSTSLTLRFDSNMTANRTTVFSGPLTWGYTASQWAPLNFAGHFDYDGQSNLVVEVRYRGGKGGSSCRRATTLPRVFTWGTGAYAAASAAFGDPAGLKMRFTIEDIHLGAPLSVSPGQTVPFTVYSKPDASRAYQLGTSFGTGPIPLGPRRIPIAADDLLATSVGGSLPWIFAGYAGKLDKNGRATAGLALPGDNRLKGLTLHSAFLVLDAPSPFGVGRISNRASFKIQ